MNKKVLLMALCAVFFKLAFLPLHAIKAYPNPINITQPDGTQLTIKLQGDENYHYQTTEDGYLLKRNSNNLLTYATLNSNGEAVESDIIAKNISKRTAKEIQFLKTAPKSESKVLINNRLKSRRMSASTQPRKAYPLNGSPKALVILANFSDKAFNVSSPQTSFQNLVTQSGYSANGGTGSAKDYFMASSYGKFSPDFIVVGPVTLPKTLDYYGKNDVYKQDTNPAQMIVDACTAANTAGLDFTPFDTDGDGNIDNVFVYYAGYNEAEGADANTIWPHRWNISSASITTGITFDGKKIEDYSCTSELKGATGTNMCGIGTFCHEFGHVLGLPDYYDTSGVTSNTTLETWEVMDYGPYLNGGNTPPTYSAWDRFYLGYLKPQQISSGADITLQPLYQGTTQPANTDGQAYLFSATTHNMIATSPNPAEFFLVEYRKHTGWDTYLGQTASSIGTNSNIPSDGLCIWHIDYLQSAWDSNGPNNANSSTQTPSSHMRCYLQPLSGQTTTPGTTFTTGSFTPTTWSGTNINRAITSITKTADNVSFKLMGGVVSPTVSATGSFTAFSTIFGTPSAVQSVVVNGAALTGNLDVSLTNQTNFDIKLSTGSTWGKTVTLIPSSGTASATIQVRYNPASAGTQTDQLTLASTGATTVNLSLSGTSTVPVDPNAPVTNIGKIENLIKFPATKSNVSSTKIINIKTTDIVGSLSLIITGTNSTLFSVSASSITKDAANASTGVNINISYSPNSIGSHTATLTISGGGLPEKVITLNGEGI
ncbi:MAG: M6 family metalloprotease domain-containing protein [Paludibacter sp.]